MNLHDLTAPQLEKLRNAIAARLKFLKHLRERTEARFDAEDRFCRNIAMAEMLLSDSMELVEVAWNLKCTRAHDRGKRFPR